jgi:hypothetical protein
VPYRDYVPLAYDLSDATAAVRHLQADDARARAIAAAGARFAKTHFRPEEIVCYMAMLLSRFAPLLGYPVRRHPQAQLLPDKPLW